jgi:Domain of unknown function (DUF4440)
MRSPAIPGNLPARGRSVLINGRFDGSARSLVSSLCFVDSASALVLLLARTRTHTSLVVTDWNGERVMRRYFGWICVIFLLDCCLAIAQQPQSAPAQNSATSQTVNTSASPELTNLLDAKIKAEWEAIKNRDPKALGELLTDDYIGVEADREGERYKWKALAELQNSAVTDYTLSFLKVTPLCQDAAFVRYEVFIHFPPKSTVRWEKILVGEIWVKRDGAWKSMHYQETKVK